MIQGFFVWLLGRELSIAVLLVLIFIGTPLFVAWFALHQK